MGLPMGRNLLTAGYDLVVHSRSPGPVDELVALGASDGSSPAGVAEEASIVITMLPDTPDVDVVLFGPGGVADAVRPGHLIIDMSTIEPLAARDFALRLAKVEVAFLDAPVSGGQQGAIDGTLAIMVGGDERDLERARTIFEVVGANVVHIGAVGAGQTAKACNQLVVAATIEAVAEALVLAAKSGVDPAAVRAALLGGFASSRVLEVHGSRMLAATFAPGFRIALHDKDAGIIRRTAQKVRSPIPLFTVVADRLSELHQAGQGALDHSALITSLENEAGLAIGRWAQPSD